ncbi:hypothetical protein GALMADRAFT_863055 [Galerina marginata CBS 339.88]|uniref:Uncharacterized protein n=1 Tax=Galerina marginata (strain CBS 339.88) TaxID=685588 RepID=A0A067TSY8_GALM3|nr:hypothetical protein GALMADRAFT_863055 [Galerina marginata CBS 339.88]
MTRATLMMLPIMHNLTNFEHVNSPTDENKMKNRLYFTEAAAKKFTLDSYLIKLCLSHIRVSVTLVQMASKFIVLINFCSKVRYNLESRIITESLVVSERSYCELLLPEYMKVMDDAMLEPEVGKDLADTLSGWWQEGEAMERTLPRLNFTPRPHSPA